MSSTFPTVTAYLDALPAGVASHPQCMVKASLVRNAIESRPLGPDVPLPPPVRALVDAPPPVSVWVPEVHFNVVMQAVRDAHFDAQEDRFLEWVYTQNRKLFAAPLYRAMFFLISPERLLVNLQRRWSSLRVGSTLEHEPLGPGLLRLRVTTPPRLYSMEVASGLATAVRAAIDAAGGKQAEVTPTLPSDTSVELLVRWR